MFGQRMLSVGWVWDVVGAICQWKRQSILLIDQERECKSWLDAPP